MNKFSPTSEIVNDSLTKVSKIDNRTFQIEEAVARTTVLSVDDLQAERLAHQHAIDNIDATLAGAQTQGVDITQLLSSDSPTNI